MIILRSFTLYSAFLALWSWPSRIISAEQPATDIESTESAITLSNSDMFGSLIWLILSMALVIFLIVVVIKWLSQRNRAWGVNPSLRSLGGIAVGQNASVQIVELAGRVYVVGVGDTVTLLDKFDEPEQAQAVREALEQRQQVSWINNPIEKAIQKMRNNRTNSHEKEPVNEHWQSASSFQQMLDNQMHTRSERKKQLEDLLKETKTNERLMDDEK